MPLVLSGVTVVFTWDTMCTVPCGPPSGLQAMRPTPLVYGVMGPACEAVQVLPLSVVLDTNSPPSAPGVMLALVLNHRTYALPLLSTVTAGLRPPRLAAWSGWAARLPAAGGAAVVVVTPGARVVAVGEVIAFWRMAGSFQAASVMLTGSPKF